MADKTSLDLLWILLSTVLVLLMQAGFLCLESGLTRSKNAINVALKNAADLVLSLLLWWALAFGLMFGVSEAGWIGTSNFLFDAGAAGGWGTAFFLFQAMFCATAATIVSGAVAERTRFGAYLAMTLLMVALIYPVFGHWTWGGALDGAAGWLGAAGFVDFAGSTVVHSVGGWVALAAVLIIGPRTGRFDNGQVHPMPASNLPLAMLGILLFVVGWVGFNGGSTLAFSAAVPAIIANTVLAGVAGGLVGYVYARLRPSPYLERAVTPMNGVLAGLVAITAGCHAVSSAESLAIGAVGAWLMVLATGLLGRLHIDDAIGAVPVHLAAGIWGTLAVALFGDPALLGTGLGALAQLQVQATGVLVAGAWAFGIAYTLLWMLDRMHPLRVSAEDEHVGLNVSEHGARTDLIDLMQALRSQQDSQDLSQRVPVQPFTEVGEIAAQHNRLMQALELAVSRTQAIVRDINDGIVTCTHMGQVTSMNPGAQIIFGLEEQRGLGGVLTDLLEIEQVAPLGEGQLPLDVSLLALLTTPGALRLVGRRRPDNRRVHLEVTISQSSHSDDDFTCLVHDVTERVRMEEELFAEQERAMVTLDSIGDGVITTDPQGRVAYMNRTAEQLTEWTLDEARGQRLERVFPVADSPEKMPDDALAARVLRERRPVVEWRSRFLYSRGGSVHAVRSTTAPILDRSGGVLGVVVVFQDVSQARVLERQLSYQATHDALTGLVNRTEFERRLLHLIEEGPGEGAEHILCYIDLDQFKLVNDVCGHAAGDELLRQLARLMAKRLRGTDTLARLGGDEFGILLPGCGRSKGAELAETLREEVRAFRFPWEGREFSVGASIGLVPLDNGIGSLAQALRQADAACYAAKDAGRNRVHLYQPDDEELAARSQQMAWVQRIRQALDEDRFRLHYQPIRPTTSPDQEGGAFEVLLRMLDRDGSEIPPGAFMPAAERYQLMADIDAWVVDHTLAWLGEHGETVFPAVTRCAVNLSGESIGNPRLLERIEALFERHGVAPSLICFEITETAAISNLQQAIAFISRLKRLGCRFALDDFGSGLSSFGYLRNLQVDYLKIDGAFIRDIHRNPIDYAMVQSINAIGHVMGLETIAEFVESQAIVDALAELGVDHVQGYHVGRPEPLSGYGAAAAAQSTAAG